MISEFTVNMERLIMAIASGDGPNRHHYFGAALERPSKPFACCLLWSHSDLAITMRLRPNALQAGCPSATTPRAHRFTMRYYSLADSCTTMRCRR